MRAPNERDGTSDRASGAGQDWLGNSVWQTPDVEISKLKSWAFITVTSLCRGAGESTWRGDHQHQS